MRLSRPKTLRWPHVSSDGVLAVEEQRVEPERPAALLGGQALVPVDPVLREVDLARAPVAALPARVEVLVGDRAGGPRRRARDGHDRILSDRPVSSGVTSVTLPARE